MKFLNIFFLMGALLIFNGCNTVAPKSVTTNQASFDNGKQNSGFEGFTTNNGVCYGMLSTNAYLRYDALISLYGNKFLPPITKDYGISNNNTNYLITLQGLSDFATMNRWHKSGK